MDLAQHFLHVNGPHDKAVIVFHKGSDEIHKGMMPAFFRGEMKDVIGEADTLLMIQSHISMTLTGPLHRTAPLPEVLLRLS